MINETESWQVEVKGQIYDTTFGELTKWIGAGAVMREDKARRGNLRWLEAGRIPTFVSFFSAKDLNAPPDLVSSVNSPAESFNFTYPLQPAMPSISDKTSQDLKSESEFDFDDGNTEAWSNESFPTQLDQNSCVTHPELEAVFACESCFKAFCAGCPKKYGGTVRICPRCGMQCHPLSEIHLSQPTEFQYEKVMSPGFGFEDFGIALKYPLRFKTSLIVGGIMFAFFSLGQSAAGFGGIYMFVAAIFSGMMANMFTFGILANTVENFSLGKLGKNFMPSFDDFELWKDVIQPVFLSLGVYLVSFGLLAGLVIGGIWFASRSISTTSKVDAVSTVMPDASRDLQSVKSISPIDRVKQDLNKDNLYENGEIPDDAKIAASQSSVNSEEAEFAKLQQIIDNRRKGQLETVVGEVPKDQQTEKGEVVGTLAGMAIPVIILAILTLLWGIFFFPAACLVAGYTRSFAATINPLNGLETIKSLGFDYAKVLGMCFVMSFAVVILSAVVGTILSPFNLPMMGNIPAKFVLSLVTFYVAITFSVILGLAMYKNLDKLKA